MGWTREWLAFYLQRHPLLFRTLMRVGDELGRNKLLFTRATQVRSIFERSRDFQVGYTIAPRTKLGPFLLSMDEGPRHTQEKRALKRAIDRSEVTLVAEANKLSAELALTLAESCSERVDIGSDFAERVFVRSLAACFGLPLDGWHSDHLDTPPGERTLALFIRTLGGTLGSKLPATFGLEQLAELVAPEFEQQLTAAVDQRRKLLQTQPPGDTLLDWLLSPRPQPDEDEEQVRADADFVQKDGLARSLGGLLAAGASFPKAFSNVLFELAQHKELENLAKFRHLPPAAWAAHVEPYVLEALRFRPAFPGLVRYCPRATSLAGAAIPAGTTLGFSPLAAMFDPAVVERPEVFIAGRPKEVYYIFGGGPRACIGQRLMLQLFPPMLQALFKYLPELCHMTTGEYRYDGPALEHFWVDLPARPCAEIQPQPTQRLQSPPSSRPPLAAAAVPVTRSSVPPRVPPNVDGGGI
jgi:cytochrome P450